MGAADHTQRTAGSRQAYVCVGWLGEGEGMGPALEGVYTLSMSTQVVVGFADGTPSALSLLLPLRSAFP